ncbi:uncharacterized protein [Spinacia oleracea]|uniref:Uncharacterized protein isoform X1 n=1 Tax=Spinacia oleracea TaxID=3562 RepID=A0A9R0IMW4_SPIOL|nr:uncharacterized protein LOC110791863 isoform X1 [Spinacia oleracea]
MQRYRMDEGLDEYEDDLEDQYGDGDEDQYEEDEGEEEEEPLSEEAIKYLETRERLKAKHRSNLRRENGKNGVNVNHTKLMNYGSFFGPSKPVIADRVIQERKSLLETRHLTPKVSTSQNDVRIFNVKRVSIQSNTTSKNGLSNNKPRPIQVKSKAQILKQTRDYSFLLSDEAEIPKPVKDPPGPQRSSAPKHGSEDARSSQVRAKRPEPSSSHSYKKGNAVCEQRKPSSSGISHAHDPRRAPPQKSPSGSNRASLPSDSRRQLDLRKQSGSSSGSGSTRPPVQKVLPPKKHLYSSDRKVPVGSVERKSSATPMGNNKASVVAKSSTTLDRQRLPMGKPHSSGVTNNRVEQRRDVQRSTENRPLRKENGVTSKYQTVKPPPPRQGSLQSNVERRNDIRKQNPAGELRNSSAVHKIKKRKAPDSDDEMDYSSVIRKMFGRPTKYYDDDDDDDRAMEVGFDSIMAEERKSARIAKQEDDEEFIKIQEEERQEMLRKKAKMRKMSHR